MNRTTVAVSVHRARLHAAGRDAAARELATLEGVAFDPLDTDERVFWRDRAVRVVLAYTRATLEAQRTGTPRGDRAPRRRSLGAGHALEASGVLATTLHAVHTLGGAVSAGDVWAYLAARQLYGLRLSQWRQTGAARVRHWLAHLVQRGALERVTVTPEHGAGKPRVRYRIPSASVATRGAA